MTHRDGALESPWAPLASMVALGVALGVAWGMASMVAWGAS
jgi:hypothetical protein